MPIAPLFAAAFVLVTATEPLTQSGEPAMISAQERKAATESRVRTATDCIVHAVTADPRYSTHAAKLGDLIVDSMPSCVRPMQAMIRAYDRYYGAGTGEAFFMGPYLAVLPRAVIKAVKDLR